MKFNHRRLTSPVHLLTVVRIPLAAVVWLRPHDPTFLVGMLALAAFTDIIDGAVARWLDPSIRTDPHNPGAWLDPVCDKIFIASAAAAIVVSFHPPWIFVGLLLLRDIVQLPILLLWSLFWRRRGQRMDFRAVPAGKITTVLQFFGMAAVMFAPHLLPFLAPAAAFTGVVAVWIVVRRGARVTA